MKAYKIVKKLSDGRLVSFSTTGKAQVEYKPQLYVQAPDFLRERGYHLCCFRELKQAMDWARFCRNVEVWECEIEPVWQLPPCGIIFEDGEISVIHEWEWPSGTVMARKVKLVKKLMEVKEPLGIEKKRKKAKRGRKKAR